MTHAPVYMLESEPLSSSLVTTSIPIYVYLVRGKVYVLSKTTTPTSCMAYLLPRIVYPYGFLEPCHGTLCPQTP